MIRRLFNMGVKPEALLLPKRPDQGKCKMCTLHSLQALLDILLVQCKNDLSRHKEVMRRCHLPASLMLCSLRPSSPMCRESGHCLHQSEGPPVLHACFGPRSAWQDAGLTLPCAQEPSPWITARTGAHVPVARANRLEPLGVAQFAYCLRFSRC